MKIKVLSVVALLLALVVLQGCGSGNPPKEGIPIQANDYHGGPGGMAKGKTAKL